MYFKGPANKLNLKAHNLQLFTHLADGVDDETWEFHSERTRSSPRRSSGSSSTRSRAAIKAAIEKRYTLPADRPSGVVDEEAAAIPSSRHATSYQ